MNKPLLLLFSFFCILGVLSCTIGKKPVRKTVRPNKYTITKRYGTTTVDTAFGIKKMPVQPAVPEDRKKKLIAGLQPLWQKEIQFNTFSGKARMHYEGMGQKQEFTAHFRIQKDKAIWVNITALGGVVNVARALITHDSVIVINYLQKEVYRMPMQEANKLLPAPVNYSILQNFIVGDVMQKEGAPKEAADVGNVLSLQMESDDLIQQVTYAKADSSMRSLQMLSRNTNGPSGMMKYNDYKTVNGKLFSAGRVINLTNNGEPYYLEMDFNNAEFDQPVEMPFSVPKNYRVK